MSWKRRAIALPVTPTDLAPTVRHRCSRITRTTTSGSRRTRRTRSTPYRPKFNPDGNRYVDLGLGAIVDDPDMYGMFRVPTLRNVALTPPYMHNGVFKTLYQAVAFYNTRDAAPWPAPEWPENVNRDELGNLGLTTQEIEDIVAFLRTLSDGYRSRRER
jgi:cytochrome c peroxidase